MTYVDQLIHDWRGQKWCHLTADTLDELHEMASKIGLKRAWFQDKAIPHYDIVKSKRELAIQHGAIEISTQEMIKRRAALLKK